MPGRRAAGSAPLLQERLGRRDPWRVAVVCACLNRASGRQAEPALREIFRRWSTAEALHRTVTTPIDSPAYDAMTHVDLADVVRPLGFVRRRVGTIVEAARIAYLNAAAGSTRAETVRGLSAVKGVGPYAVASMRAFCLGDLSVRCADKEVGPRVAFLRRARRRGAR